ncbi:hypothetical protein GW17_00051801 [Ensete ventricosum]|nr:hypothetical protein GW17_00051801 [Ensete ventricosum]
MVGLIAGDRVAGGKRSEQQDRAGGLRQWVAAMVGKGNGATEEEATMVDGLQAVEGWRRHLKQDRKEDPKLFIQVKQQAHNTLGELSMHSRRVPNRIV